ncbi:MAG: acyl carrier protein [Planctomycetaceae bacterium]
MSTEKTLEETVVEIVSEQLQVEKKSVLPASSFIDDLKADSLDIVELVMEFEERFKISIPDEDYDKIKTVGDAIKYIKDKEGKA